MKGLHTNGRTARRGLKLLVAAGTAAACLLPHSAYAVLNSFTWANPTDGSWSNATNWVEGSAPVSSNTTQLTFTTGSYITTNDLGDLTVDSMTFNNTDQTSNLINLQGTNTITFDGANPILSLTGGSATFGPNLASTNGMDITNSGGGSLLLNGQNMRGTTTITNSGPGTITLGDSFNFGPIYFGQNILLNLANTGVGTLNLGNVGPSTSILNSGLSGTINISAGAVTFAGSTSGDLFGSAMILNVAGGASFNFANNPETMGGLSGAGNVILGTAGMTFVERGNRSFTGTISGTGGMSQSNADILTLGGSNSYSGTTTVTGGGTIRVTAPDVLSPNSVVNVVNGLLDLGGFSQTIAGLSGGNNLGQPLTLNSLLTINPAAGKIDNFYSGVAGQVSVVIGGQGVQSLLGPNTYTGSTNISSGTLRINVIGLTTSGITVAAGATLDGIANTNGTWSVPLAGTGAFIKDGSGRLTFSSATGLNPSSITVANGTLAFDQSTDNNALLGSNPPATFNGGSFTYKGNSSAASIQSFNGSSIGTTLGGAASVVVTSGSGQNATLALGGITRNIGATVDFNTINTQGGTASISTPTAPAAGGILGAYATFNQTDWATISNGNIVPLPAASYSSAFATGANVNLASPATVPFGTAAANVINSLKLNATLAFNNSSDSLTISSGGILVPSTVATAIAIGATGKTGKLLAPNGELVIDTNASQPLTIVSVISNGSAGVATSLTKTGNGTLILSAANTYTGATYLNGGTIQASAQANIGAAAAPLFINGGTLSIPTGTIGAVANTSGAVIHPVIIGPAGATFNFGSSFSWNGNGIFGTGTIVKNGAGQWSVGSNASTFSGNVIINGGIFRFTSSQFGSATGMTINSGAQYMINDDATANFGFAAGAPVNLAGAGPSTSAATTPGAFILTDQSPTGSPGVVPNTTFTNPVTLTADTTVGIYNGSSTRTAALTFSSAISGPGNLIKVGNGVLTLSNESNQYGGANGLTILSNGAIRNGALNALPTSTTLQFGQNGSTDPGTYDLNGFNQTLAGMTVNSGTGHVVVNSNTSTPSVLTVNYNGAANQVFTAQIGGGTVGSPTLNGISLVKSGTGSLSLTGTGTYSGSVTVAAGSLRVTGNSSLTNARDYIVNDGANLIVTNTDPAQSLPVTNLSLGVAGTSNLTFELTGGVPTIGALVISGNATINGNVNIAITSVQQLTTGQFSLINYTGSLGGAGFAGFNPVVSLPNRVIGSLVNDVANHSVDLNITGVDSLVWNGNLSGDWDINTTANWKLKAAGTATTYLQSPTSDSVAFDAAANGTKIVNLTTTLTPASVTVSGATDYTFSGPGTIAGNGGLTKSDGGALTILTNNSNSGLTTVNGGTLQIGNGGTTGALGTGAIIDNASLVFNRSDNVAIASRISGSGSIAKNGANSLTLTGALNLGGNVSIAGGVLSVAGGGTVAGDITGPGVLNISLGALQIGNSGTTGSVGTNVTLSNSGTLTFNRSDAITFGGNIIGNGNIIVNNGSVKLTGSLSYDGTTSVGANTLEIASNTDTILTNKLSGTGTFIKSGAGQLTLLNSNTGFTGNFIVNGGNVLLEDNGAGGDLNAGSIVINNGGKFIFGAGNIAGENPDFPGTTFVTVNTGGTFEIRVGEDFGGVSLQGGTYIVNSAGSTLSSTSGPFLGLDLQSGFVQSIGTAAGFTAANTGGGVVKTTTGTVSLTGPLTYSAATPITILEGVFSAQAVSLPTSGTAALTIGGGPTTATLQLSDTGSATISRPVTLNSGASIDTPATLNGTTGSLTISSVISGGDLLKTGVDKLTLSGSNNYTGNTNIAGGTLELATNGVISSSPNILIASGSTFTLASSTSATGTGANSKILGNVIVSAGGVVAANLAVNHLNHLVIVPTSLALAGATDAWTSRVDLGSNDLDLAGASLATVTNQVKQGFAGGNWNGSGGIGSLAAANDPTRLTALGVIINSVDGTTTGAALYGGALGTFDGLSPASTDVLVKYTYYGDTNLDGKIDGTDYSRIDAAFGGTASGWYNGDFNYDGVINGSDYTLIDNAYNSQGVSLAAEIASPTAEISAGSSSVPEPTSVALLVVAAIGLLGRRQRA